MSRKKLFLNDLLALAIALLVSLLFVDAAAEFISPSNKNVGVPVSVVSTTEEAIDHGAILLSENTHHFHHPAENIQNVDSGVSLTNIFTSKGMRAVILDLSSYWELSAFARIACCYDWLNTPNFLWSPSISIALRRLLI